VIGREYLLDAGGWRRMRDATAGEEEGERPDGRAPGAWQPGDQNVKLSCR